jgi:hypothetical protein
MSGPQDLPRKKRTRERIGNLAYRFMQIDFCNYVMIDRSSSAISDYDGSAMTV